MKKILATLLTPPLFLLTIGCGMEQTKNAEDTPRVSIQDSPTPYVVNDADRTKAMEEMVAMRKTMLALEGQVLAPAQEDLDQNHDFLSMPNTGIVRIFPHESTNEKRPILVSGQGSYYQFKNRQHAYGYGSDLKYSTERGPQFSVGFAGVDYGFMAELGKVDIQTLDTTNPKIRSAMFIKNLNNETESAWRNEQRKWSHGATIEGVQYADTAAATVGMSYVLRSISEGKYDVLIVFQVVRRDPRDGSLILVWKMISEFDKPVLNRI